VVSAADQDVLARSIAEAPRSVLSAGSLGSVLSAGSILSIGSSGSILSIGSAGSILSVGSVGSILSVGSCCSALSVRSAFSILGRDRAFTIGRQGQPDAVADKRRQAMRVVSSLMITAMACGLVLAGSRR
jgi:hypothetical protein